MIQIKLKLELVFPRGNLKLKLKKSKTFMREVELMFQY